MKVLRKETSVNRLAAKDIDGWWRGRERAEEKKNGLRVLGVLLMSHFRVKGI